MSTRDVVAPRSQLVWPRASEWTGGSNQNCGTRLDSHNLRLLFSGSSHRYCFVFHALYCSSIWLGPAFLLSVMLFCTHWATVSSSADSKEEVKVDSEIWILWWFLLVGGFYDLRHRTRHADGAWYAVIWSVRHLDVDEAIQLHVYLDTMMMVLMIKSFHTPVQLDQ